jgi:hypothetical protein
VKDEYRANLGAHLSIDDEGVVRSIVHSDEYWLPSDQGPRPAATEYFRSFASVLDVAESSLDRLHEPVGYLEPREEQGSFRLGEEKQQFDGATVEFVQTDLNVPVWRHSVTVSVKLSPSRVVGSANNSLADVSAKLPPEEAIDRWRKALESISARPAAAGEANSEALPADRIVADALGLAADGGRGKGKAAAIAGADRLRVNRGRFYVYRYDPDERLDKQPDPQIGDKSVGDLESDDYGLVLPLPEVPRTIQAGRDYLVAEVVFSLPLEGIGSLNWRALIEVESNAVLYLRALISGVNGLVFTYDPLTSTGVLTNTADRPNAVLNPLRDDVTLNNLNGPVAGTRALAGSRVVVIDDDAPAVAPPTEPTGTDFDYQARTNDFAAVNAYYHANNFFTVIESLGFQLSSYFDGTSFPIHVDHRASFGNPQGLEINAFCGGDAQGDGIGLVGYCLGDLTDTGNPLGRAVDKWVHWHEIGGHGILWDHVESPNFGFAHSAGDGLAGLQNDPESQLRGLPERFLYAPFRAGLNRRMDRDVAAGWGWGGANDTGGYNSEQILATSHFRIYQSIGGDSDNLGRRLFAARFMTYLIVRAVGELTPGTNPGNAQLWCDRLIKVDKEDWTFEGLPGGAYNKVIRWAFEKQGLYQPAGAPVPVTSAGAPPDVDVYIDDGRGGEYPYQPVHWANPSIWNRNAADGLSGHQSAIQGATNYMYAKVKNRGTVTASNVTVKGFHSLPGAGLTWPVDFTSMTPTAGLVAASVVANSAAEVTVGPFEWVPNVNAYGHDCVLMIASVPGDVSNTDLLGPGETIEEWRLVPNDNNVAQRNVQLVPGGGGPEALIDGLHRRFFMAGNTFQRKATMVLQVQMPEPLASLGWTVRFPGITSNRFVLAPKARREVVIELVPGRGFTTDQVTAASDRDITVSLLADDILIGGMTYRLDPALTQVPGGDGPGTDRCKDRAQDLLECLHIPGDKVKSVHVKKVSIDVCMDDDCC